MPRALVPIRRGRRRPSGSRSPRARAAGRRAAGRGPPRPATTGARRPGPPTAAASVPRSGGRPRAGPAALPSASAVPRAPTSGRGCRCRRGPAKAWRTRSRAAGFPRAVSCSPHAGGKASRAPCETARSSPGTAATRTARPSTRSRRGRSGWPCIGLGISTSLSGRELAGGDRVQQDLRAGVVAADQRPRPARLAHEAGHHLGQPVRRVGMARAVLRVAVQRQVGQHEPVAVAELLHHRLPLAVREQPRVQQRQRAPRPRLAVGDARAVVVVVEAELHRLAATLCV